MRNYDMQNPTATQSSDVKKKKEERDKVMGKTSKPMTIEDDDFDDFGEFSDDDDDFDDDENFSSKSNKSAKKTSVAKKPAPAKPQAKRPIAIEEDDDEDDEYDEELDDFDDEDEEEFVEPPKKQKQKRREAHDDEFEEPSEKPKVKVNSRGEGDDGKLYDHRGYEAKIDKPMWKSNEKRKEKEQANLKKGKQPVVDKTPTWQRPPSRMSVGEWFITLLIMLVPGLNIIMLLVWAFFSDGVQEEKKNFSKAFMLYVIAIILAIIIGGTMMGKVHINKAQLQNKFNSTTSSFKEWFGSEIDQQQSDAMDNYNHLTDDDFTN